MRAWELRTRIRLPRPRPEVFAFFGDAGNLEALTPGWLRFRILTPMPITLHAGSILDYQIRLHGIPVRWRTEITAWEPSVRFVDEQRRGPYRLWVHEHTFTEVPGGTLVDDRVRYQVPGGALVHRFFVARDLRAIFTFRSAALRRLLGGEEEDAGAVEIS